METSGGSQPGQLGPYLIEGELSRGGQGVVYRARHARLGTPVAVKVLLSPDPVDRGRFAQEAQVLARLTHPHLPRVTDLGELDGRPYMAMELIQGQDLSKKVQRDGPQPWSWAARTLAAVARALAHCHAAGVLHRDVKPANVVIEAATGRAVLIDFGMLKSSPEAFGGEVALDALSRTGEIKGTPQYMAPEQAEGVGGAQVGPAADVYALGATLYFLLTGQPPFAGRSLMQVLRQVLEEPPPDPRAAAPGTPPALAELCRAAMSKDPAARPASAQEMAERLETLAGGTVAGSGGRPRAPLIAGAVLVLSVGGAGLALLAPHGAAGPPAQAATPAPAAGAESPPPERAGDPPWKGAIARAIELHTSGQPRRALEVYTQVLAADPLCAKAWAGCGGTRLDLGEHARARSDLERALQLDPTLVAAWFNLGLLRGLAGDLPGAVEACDRVLALDPRHASAAFTRGKLRADLGDEEGALRDYDLAIASDPRHAQALCNRGNLRKERGDLQGALADLDAALASAPGLNNALASRGSVQLQLGRREEGLRDIDLALQREPSAPWAGRYRALREAARAHAPAGPGVDEERARRATSLFKRADQLAAGGELVAARAAYDEALALDPARAAGWNQRGNLRSRLGDPAGALADYEQALVVDPDLVPALTNRGRLRMHGGDLEGALADFERALVVDPRYPQAVVNRGVARKQRGELQAALEDAERAVQLAPTLPNAVLLRGEVRAMRGDDRGALDDLDRALSLQPDGPWAADARALRRAVQDRLERGGR